MFVPRLNADSLLSRASYPNLLRFVAFLGTVVALVATTGCGPHSELLEVSGEVILDGTPVKSGSIRLTSVGSEKLSSTGALIQDGKFLIPQEKGLLPGTYQVVISAGDENAPQVMAGGGSGQRGMAVAKELIPAKYNTESKETIDVTIEGDNHFVFDIKSSEAG